jgi:hypothetical protein
MPTPIGTIGAVEAITVGGRVFTDLDNLKTLFAYVSGVNLNSSLVDQSTGTAYQVPGGKVFKMLALSFSSGGAADSLTLGYADNNVGISSTTAFVNHVQLGGGGGFFTPVNTGVGAGDFEISMGSGMSVPAGKYPCVNNGTASTGGILVYGYEV